MFDNTFFRELSGFYASCKPEVHAAGELVYLNTKLADELGLTLPVDDDLAAALLGGKQLFEGSEPIAQMYAGHQFGHFNPSLGDGRALVLGERVRTDGVRVDLALKGSGRTPFSRNGDGKAALGPMLREVLISEAMHAMHIPTTRSLSVVQTNEVVYRDRALPGAVLARVASSHIRIGTFQYFAARGEYQKVKSLADYSIRRHYSELIEQENPYALLLRAVSQRQAALVAKWMGIGFIHGVMNTDNVSIAGETIDYGPCAFLETYDLSAVFSSIDHAGRYAYGNQAHIMQWNLARFAETLLPLIAESFAGDIEQARECATEIIEEFESVYQRAWHVSMAKKLGVPSLQEGDPLLQDWLNLLAEQKCDFILAWRYLGDAVLNDRAPLRALMEDQATLDVWLDRWYMQLDKNDLESVSHAIKASNPIVIPRNHQVEAALSAAENQDMDPFCQLLEAVQMPYDIDEHKLEYSKPAPKSFTNTYQTFCGT